MNINKLYIYFKAYNIVIFFIIKMNYFLSSSIDSHKLS